MDRAQQSRDPQEELETSHDDDHGGAPSHGATSDGGQAKAGDAPAPAGAGGAKGAGAWNASPGVMSAMGLEVGSAGGDKLEGITTPPEGQASGLAIPDVKKTLEDKKTLMQKAGIPASPSSGDLGARGAATPAAPAPATTPAAPAPAAKPAAPAPAAKPAAAAPAAKTAGAGDGTPPVDALLSELEHGTDPAARIKAAQQLARSTSPKARPALERAARDQDTAVASAARKALDQLGTAR